MPVLRPRAYVADVTSVDLASLRAAGVRAILLDIDNTVLPLHKDECPPKIAEWVFGLGKAGFRVRFVSNNWHADVRERVARFRYGVTAKAMKPLPFGLRNAAEALGVEPRECAMIGDQIFTDVLAGNLAGCVTVLVQPLTPSDLPHTVVLRHVERLIMANRAPEG
ncbi:MAG: YqeG family HAD IIIA-type phosphatase [Coriobacteriia bacterium]